MNRNFWFLLGLVLMFIGAQFCYIHSFVLNDKSSTFVTQKFGSTFENALIRPLQMAGVPTPKREIHPPEWLGLSLISVSAVLVLHSLAMRKPGSSG